MTPQGGRCAGLWWSGTWWLPPGARPVLRVQGAPPGFRLTEPTAAVRRPSPVRGWAPWYLATCCRLFKSFHAAWSVLGRLRTRPRRVALRFVFCSLGASLAHALHRLVLYLFSVLSGGLGRLTLTLIGSFFVCFLFCWAPASTSVSRRSHSTDASRVAYCSLTSYIAARPGALFLRTVMAEPVSLPICE